MMYRRILVNVALAALVGLITLSPVLVGVFSFTSIPTALIVAALPFLLYVFLRPSPRGMSIGLVLVAICLGLTVFDLFSRAFLAPMIFRHAESRLFVRRWPTMPFLYRYVPNLEYSGPSYGDLAAKTGRKEDREVRELRFMTDHRGFRNDPEAAAREKANVDIVVLGDSFGAGTGTTQSSTWTSLLAKRHGRRVYNMSIPAYGPSHALINLEQELPSLGARAKGATLLWMIFAGNDLDDACLPPGEEPKIPWWERFPAIVSFQSFRLRSPLHELLRQVTPQTVSWDSTESPKVYSVEFLGRRVLFFHPYVMAAGRTLDQVRKHPNYACMEATVRAMKELATANEMDLAIVLAPSKAEVYSWAVAGNRAWSTRPEPSGLSTALGQLSRHEQIPFLDLKPYFVAASRRAFERSGGLLWWRDDTHWSPLGHSEAADLIYQHLLLRRGRGGE